jgi:hypothetical protein
MLSFPIGMIVELHRKPDHLVARAREKRSGHGRVDAAGHCHDYAHNPF